jgi:hypothetical protein
MILYSHHRFKEFECARRFDFHSELLVVESHARVLCGPTAVVSSPPAGKQLNCQWQLSSFTQLFHSTNNCVQNAKPTNKDLTYMKLNMCHYICGISLEATQARPNKIVTNAARVHNQTCKTKAPLARVASPAGLRTLAP